MFPFIITIKALNQTKTTSSSLNRSYKPKLLQLQFIAVKTLHLFKEMLKNTVILFSAKTNLNLQENSQWLDSIVTA